MENKLILPLVIASGAVVAYFISKSSTGGGILSSIFGITTSTTPTTTTTTTGISSTGWYLDKKGLDLLDATEQQLANKVWTKAQPYLQLISDYGKEFNVFLPLTLAFILVESAFNPNARRYEKSLGVSSLGLMQILTTTAKDMGFYGSEQELLDPVNNLRYGIKYVAYQLNRYKRNLEKTAAAYNAGSAQYNSKGKFINQTYVDNVVRNYNIIKTAIVKR